MLIHSVAARRGDAIVSAPVTGSAPFGIASLVTQGQIDPALGRLQPGLFERPLQSARIALEQGLSLIHI